MVRRMLFVAGIFYLVVGMVPLFFTPSVARRQGAGTAVCGVLWGLFFCTFGILDFAEGFGLPLLSRETRSVVFIVCALVCLPSLLLIRRPKKS
jgi:hypothetical protein